MAGARRIQLARDGDEVIENDRWRGVFSFYENATYEYTVEAWTDAFGGWQHEFTAKFEAGFADLRSEALEGAALLEARRERPHDPHDAKRLRELARADADKSAGRGRFIDSFRRA